MTLRRAVVHVGLEKTGSTAIQSWLHGESGALRSEGILVPRSIGSPNHTRLVAACLDDGVVDNLKAHFLSERGESEGRFRARTKAAFDAEVGAARDWSTLVVSSELISSRLHSPTEVLRLAGWLAPHVDSLHFVIYLRRQDDLAVSRFSSALRAGHDGFDDIWSDLSAASFLRHPPERSVADGAEYFDFSRIIGRLEAVAGARIDVRLYEAAPPGGTIVDDFASILGLPQGRVRTGAARANPALSAEAQYVISQLNRTNRVQWPSGARNTPYRALLRKIEGEVTGARRMVPRAEAQGFVDRFRASNAEVAGRWLGGEMFHDRFDHWPESVDYGALRREMAPVLAKYQALAQALPQVEPRRAVWKRWWTSVGARLTP